VEKEAYVLESRQFSIQIRVDDTVTTGEYALDVTYRNYDSKSIIFTVYDAVSKSAVKIPEPKENSIPEWIKNNARWWTEGTIDDNSFKQGIQHMIKENIISIKDLPKASGASENKIPDWVKNNAKWWADGIIGEDDFVNGLKYMVEKGIIGVNYIFTTICFHFTPKW
jgi:hypothetical protein